MNPWADAHADDASDRERIARQVKVKIPDRGRELSELGRRAGLHIKTRPDRANTRRRAIADDCRAG
jgi:hypothetical protein